MRKWGTSWRAAGEPVYTSRQAVGPIRCQPFSSATKRLLDCHIPRGLERDSNGKGASGLSAPPAPLGVAAELLATLKLAVAAEGARRPAAQVRPTKPALATTRRAGAAAPASAAGGTSIQCNPVGTCSSCSGIVWYDCSADRMSLTISCRSSSCNAVQAVCSMGHDTAAVELLGTSVPGWRCPCGPAPG